MIRIESDIVTFSFEHHVNVIGGFKDVGLKSGSYKTALFVDLLNAWREGKIVSSHELVFLDDSINLNAIEIDSHYCYIIDELNFAPYSFEKFFEKIGKANGYAIVIGRLFIKQINYEVSAVYTLTKKTAPYELEPIFEVLNAKKGSVWEQLITEDSEHVAKFYSDNLNTVVTPANGKNRILKTIKGIKVPFIIADNPKFGPILINILDRIINDTKYFCKTLYLFLPACFEEFLLSAVDDEIVREHIVNAKPIDSFDAEIWCEQNVKFYYSDYDKNNVQKSIEKIISTEVKESALWKLLEEMLNGEDYTFAGANHICFIINVGDYKEYLEHLEGTPVIFDTSSQMNIF